MYLARRFSALLGPTTSRNIDGNFQPAEETETLSANAGCGSTDLHKCLVFHSGHWGWVEGAAAGGDGKGGDAFPLCSGGTVLDVVEDILEHAAAGGGEGKVDADAVDEDTRDGGGNEVEGEVAKQGGGPDGAVEGVRVRGASRGTCRGAPAAGASIRQGM
jgi:hypothetical protein